ncbi:MAG: glycosyl hydrolase 53 family protein [Rhodoluna sp.]
MSMELSRRTVLKAGVVSTLIAPAASAEAAPILKNGSDISWITNYEAAGGKFFTTAGKVIDPFALLKSVKARVARIRVFVNPTYRNGRLSDALNLAQRAKSAGLEVCLDFHFSDDWADPGKQWIPTGWSTTNVSLLASQLKNYVTTTLVEFSKRGISLDYVQLGNEITNGMLWPLGKIEGSNATQWRNLATLYNAANTAFRTATPKAKSILHLDCGGDATRVRWWLYQAWIYGLRDYDIIGLSYYPQWHGSLAQLTETLEVAAWEFGKPTLIAETAYPYTTQTFGGDVIDPTKSFLKGYPLTPSGQASFLRKLKSIVRDLPNNNGVCFWWWEGMAGRVTNGSQTVLDFGMTNSVLIDTRSRPLSALSGLSS